MSGATVALLSALLSLAGDMPVEGRWVGNIGGPFAEAKDVAMLVTRTALETADRSPEMQRLRDEAMREAERRLHAGLDRLGGFLRPQRGGDALRGQLVPPVSGRPLNAGFGLRPRFSSPTEARHTGLSFSVKGDEPVVACARGIVAASLTIPGLGRTVLVEHGEGLVSIYAGLTRVVAEPGQPVEAGTRLGTAGERSLFGQRELYFELRRDGLPIDPVRWFHGTRLSVPRLLPPWRQPPPARVSNP